MARVNSMSIILGMGLGILLVPIFIYLLEKWSEFVFDFIEYRRWEEWRIFKTIKPQPKVCWECKNLYLVEGSWITYACKLNKVQPIAGDTWAILKQDRECFDARNEEKR